MSTHISALRALSRLLEYPDATLRAHALELLPAIEGAAGIPTERRAALRCLLNDIAHGDPYEAEARYVETFDRGRSTSLHLFEHVHGDARERGQAMVDLAMTYEQAGLFMREGELPDHLAVVLEFASTQPEPQALSFLGEMEHIFAGLFSALQKRSSPYAEVIAAVMELAHLPVQTRSVSADAPLDEAWPEPAAFDGCSTRGQSRPGEAQPIRIVRKTPPVSQGVTA